MWTAAERSASNSGVSPPRRRRHRNPSTLKPQPRTLHREREFFIDNLVGQIHLMIVMIRLTGLVVAAIVTPSSSLLLSSLELSDTKVYEPQIRALLGTTSQTLDPKP